MAKVKAVPFRKVLKSFSAERRARIDAMAQELIEEEMTLVQLRKALKLSQDEVADRLELHQGNMSRLERQADHKVSTLSSYVEALGGKLRLVAEFPGNHSVQLKHVQLMAKKKSAKHAKSTPARKRA